jgi:hypothetical protein
VSAARTLPLKPVPTAEGPGYLDRVLRPVHATGELRNAERCVTSEVLLAEAAAAR